MHPGVFLVSVNYDLRLKTGKPRPQGNRDQLVQYHLASQNTSFLTSTLSLQVLVSANGPLRSRQLSAMTPNGTYAGWRFLDRLWFVAGVCRVSGRCWATCILSWKIENTWISSRKSGESPHTTPSRTAWARRVLSIPYMSLGKWEVVPPGTGSLGK